MLLTKESLMPRLLLPHSWSLNRLALIAVGGAATGALLLVAGDSVQLPTWLLTVLLALSAMSWLVYQLGKRFVRQGLSEDRWSDEERRATVQVLRTGARALLPLYVLAATIYFVERFVRHRHDAVFVWFPMYLLALSMTTIRSEIAPPAPAKHGGSWPGIKPLQSEHWGERSSEL